jgi:ketosteroid isomerase-like protein
MNRNGLLLTISAFLLCISLSLISTVNAIPPTLNDLSQQANAEPVSSERIEIVRRFIQAVEAKDIDTINQLITDNIVLEQPYSELQPGGVRVEGKEAANAFFNRIFSRYSQIRFVDVVFRQSEFDNAVILEGQGDFRVANNQSVYRNQYIGVLEIVDGQITLIREYFNPLVEPEAFNPGANQPN